MRRALRRIRSPHGPVGPARRGSGCGHGPDLRQPRPDRDRCRPGRSPRVRREAHGAKPAFVEGGQPGTTHSWEREEIVSYDEAFRRELIEFADCIATGREPRTSGQDGLSDLLLCEAVARIVVANAPVSYGAFEITVGIDAIVPDPLTLLDWVQDADYEGIDLGPAGYLGDVDTLAGRLEDHQLSLAGGYLELPCSEPHKLEAALAELDSLLDVFDSVSGSDVELRAKPTLADAGSPTRKRFPDRAALDPSVGLDDAGWKRFADGLARAVELCRRRGYEPTFHHHTATYVEAPWEIERMLELSDVRLCLDTGRLLLRRGDPITAIRAWSQRINHVHLKDARLDRLEEIVAEAAPVEEIWRRRAFCALGDGDIDITQVLAALSEINYSGWLVVEQDVLPDPANPKQPALDQHRNREYLRAHGH